MYPGILLATLALAAAAHAQDVPPAPDPDAPDQTSEPADGLDEPLGDGLDEPSDRDAAHPSRRPIDLASVPASDELPEEATARPAPESTTPPPYLSPTERARWLERHYDARELDLGAIVQVFGGIDIGIASSLDRALAAHQYGSSQVMGTADITFLGLVSDWLELGVRAGGRARGWGTRLGPPAVGGAADLLAIAHARFYLGRVVDIGLSIGAGLGWGGVSLGAGAAAALGPRAHAALVLCFRVDRGARLCVRGGYDYFFLYDLDRYGHDLDMGGPVLAAGLEIRR